MEAQGLADYEVIIVGGGPVGAALAVDLGQRGVRCALIERHQQPQRIPKGQNLTNRTLEHFYFWNCVDELRAARVLPPGYPIGSVTVYDNLMSPYWHATQFAGRGATVQEYFFERNERLPQYCTEDVLRERITHLPSVTTLFGWTAEQIDASPAGVRITVAPASEAASPFFSWSADAEHNPTGATGDSRQVIECEYVVGCDGGRSMVRESMGIDRGGRNFDERMVLAVFRSRELHDALKRFPDCTTYRVLKPELHGYWQFFGRIDVGEGFFFHAPVPPGTLPDNYDFLSLLREAAGLNFAAELDYVGFWDLRIMVASQYRMGRVFIAGDACHQHPPYGGFGLNTGLEDAVNLGWKLAARLRGWGGEGLLASYNDERRPIFVETGDAMIAGGIERDRVFLDTYDPHKDLKEFEWAWSRYPQMGGNAAQSYEPHYEGSPVVFGPEGSRCSIHGRLSFSAEPGHHLAPRTLSSGRNVFEELGPGFTLVALDADDADVARFADTAAGLGVPLTVVRDTFDGDRTAYASQWIVVRPDQYVAWAGDAAPVDPAAVLTRATGRA
ncbi:MAG: FAD-dependent oxidoreductase [Chloroflexota bacterium]